MTEQKGEGFYREKYDQYRKDMAEVERAEKERWAKVAPLIEDIALEASYIPEFMRVIAEANNRREALTALQEMLPQRFPKLGELPPPAVAGIASNTFRAAQELMRLLWKERAKTS